MGNRPSLGRKSSINIIWMMAALTTLCWTAEIASADSPAEIHDPWEGMNRGIFWFNEGADRWLFEPVAKGWDFIMPDPVERSIGRFFENASFPVRFVNDMVTTPWRLSKSPRRTTQPAPSLGAHNHYVLGELLGLSAQEIVALEAQGIIGTRPLDSREP